MASFKERLETECSVYSSHSSKNQSNSVGCCPCKGVVERLTQSWSDASRVKSKKQRHSPLGRQNWFCLFLHSNSSLDQTENISFSVLSIWHFSWLWNSLLCNKNIIIVTKCNKIVAFSEVALYFKISWRTLSIVPLLWVLCLSFNQ